MSALGYKMLFRKGGTKSSILAIALLVATLASLNSIVNHISSQAEILGGFVNVGGTFLILSRNSVSLTDSEIDMELASLVNNTASAKYVLPQKFFKATLTAGSSNYTVNVRSVDDVGGFLKLRKAYVKGTAAKANEKQADVGEILARLASIDLEDEITLAINNSRSLKVKVAGVVKTLTQIDTELIIPMETVNHLTGNSGKVSFIEFALEDKIDREGAISRIIQLLPANVKVVKVQQLKEFMQDVNHQTLTFLGLWSLAVYAVVAAASYVVTTRLIVESGYELAMLRALGAKEGLMFKLILAYTVTIALLGSILGLALGITGAETASTVARWIQVSIQVNPFLEVEQALQTLLLALTSSILGCLCPAFKSVYKNYAGQL